MAIVNKFNVNNKQVTLDADIIENMSANDVSYNASIQYDENTVGEKLSELETLVCTEEIGEVIDTTSTLGIIHPGGDLYFGDGLGTIYKIFAAHVNEGDLFYLVKDSGNIQTWNGAPTICFVDKFIASEKYTNAIYPSDIDEYPYLIKCPKSGYICISYNTTVGMLSLHGSKKISNFDSIKANISDIDDNVEQLSNDYTELSKKVDNIGYTEPHFRVGELIDIDSIQSADGFYEGNDYKYGTYSGFTTSAIPMKKGECVFITPETTLAIQRNHIVLCFADTPFVGTINEEDILYRSGEPKNATVKIISNRDTFLCVSRANVFKFKASYGVVYEPYNFDGKTANVDYITSIRKVIDANKQKTYSSTVKKIGGFNYELKYVGGVFSNDKIFGLPNHSTDCLEINTHFDCYSKFSHLSDGNFKWSGGYNADDGNIYCLPRTSDSICIINPNTQQAYEQPIHTFNNGVETFYGGLVLKDNMYILSRRSNDKICVVNINDFSVRYINLPSKVSLVSAIYHPNGNMYMFPHGTGKVLKMNIQSEEISEIGDSIDSDTFGCVIAYDGNIYGYNGVWCTGITKVDVENDTTSILHSNEVSKMYGTKLGINGKIYGVCGDSNEIYSYDIETDKLSVLMDVSDTEGDETYNEAKCAGGCVAENGAIYMIPAKGRFILKISPIDCLQTFPRNILESVYFSNY